MSTENDPTSKPIGQALSEFITLSKQYVTGKRAWLKEEFDTDEYSVTGVMVVGSVAAGTERPDSDIDLYVLTKDGGDVDDFLEGVQEMCDRRIDYIGPIILNRGESFSFDEAAWAAALAERNRYNTATYHIEF